MSLLRTIFMMAAAAVGGGGGSPFLWNSADNQGMTLSDGDSIATSPGSGSGSLVRATQSFTSSSPDLYWEGENIASAGTSAFFTLCSGSTVAPVSVFGNNIDFRMIWRMAGNNQTDGVNNAFGILAWGPGDTACIAIKFSTGEYWLRLNGGAWHGGGDPATATTPTGTITYGGGSSFAGPNMFPCFYADNQPDVNAVKLRGTMGTVQYTVPAGFTTPG